MKQMIYGSEPMWPWDADIEEGPWEPICGVETCGSTSESVWG